jgi:hypothetical protein
MDCFVALLLAMTIDCYDIHRISFSSRAIFAP